MSACIDVEMFPICFFREGLLQYIHQELFCTSSVSITCHATTVRLLLSFFFVTASPKYRSHSVSLGAPPFPSPQSKEIFKKNTPVCSSGDVMSCSHAGDRDHAACPFCRGRGKRRGGDASEGPSLTSPPGWAPYCWGCPVTERTKKSRRCPRSSPKSPIQRKTPEGQKMSGSNNM